jgi:hypothetical protein
VSQLSWQTSGPSNTSSYLPVTVLLWINFFYDFYSIFTMIGKGKGSCPASQRKGSTAEIRKTAAAAPDGGWSRDEPSPGSEQHLCG